MVLRTPDIKENERATGPARYNEVQLNTRHINPDKSIEFMAQMAIHEAHERVITKSAKGEIPPSTQPIEMPWQLQSTKKQE